MTAAGDILSLTMKTEYYGQKCNNVFWYKCVTNGGTPAGGMLSLQALFTQQVLPAIRDLCTTNTAFTGYTVKNWSDLSEMQDYSLALTGRRLGDPMAPFVACGFTMAHLDKTMHQGAKRIVGCSESDWQMGGDPNPSFIPFINAATIAMQSYIVAVPPSYTSEFTPVVVSLKKGLGGSWYVAKSVALYECRFRWQTTQDTRKKGRGS